MSVSEDEADCPPDKDSDEDLSDTEHKIIHEEEVRPELICFFILLLIQLSGMKQ